MNDDVELNKLGELLREALAPVSAPMGRDLWPRMQERLKAPNRVLLVSWLDWALAAGTVLWFVAFPQAIPGFFYHF